MKTLNKVSIATLIFVIFFLSIKYNYSTEELKPKLTGKGVVIAIIDSGINKREPFLKFKTKGYNSIDGTDNIMDELGHGTMIASLLGTKPGFNPEVRGIVPDSKIIPIKVLDTNHKSPEDLANGIIWAVDHGATIINISLEYNTYNESLVNAIDYAKNKKRIIVAAAGNNSKNYLGYPANLPGIISVSSINTEGQLLKFSNYSNKVVVGAPGENINLISNKKGKWKNTFESGTSFSVAYVTGFLALIKEKHPTYDNDQIINEMKKYLIVPKGWKTEWGLGWLTKESIINYTMKK